ncbi:MAG: cytochrome P450 [Actinobacteria bacterium]|nr:cytochrome P450 [Actinomycetota bacterium]
MASRSLADLDVFDHGAPWDLFAELRDTAPVNWSDETDGGSGFWSMMKYHDIVKVLRDPETFTSTHFTNLEELDSEQEEARRSLIDSDGTRHRALRRLLQNEFTPNSVARYETFLRGLTATTLDTAFAKKEFDFLADVAADFPIRVLARLLDIPDTDIDNIIRWGNALIGSSDPELTQMLPTDAESEKFRLVPFKSPAALEVFAYGNELRRQRLGRNGVDLVSTMINQSPMDGIPLSEKDFQTTFLLLIVAGHETTRQTIAHTMNNLIDNPQVISYLQENPQDIPWAVEEFLRFASPIYHFRRTATKDVEFGGKDIKAGQKVVVWFASGNRDSDVFNDPNTMNPTRMPNEHMTFGRGGPHLCLGNALARIELIIIFEDLIARIDKVERTAPLDYVHSNFIHGIKSMPVKVTLR